MRRTQSVLLAALFLTLSAWLAARLLGWPHAPLLAAGCLVVGVGLIPAVACLKDHRTPPKPGTGDGDGA